MQVTWSNGRMACGSPVISWRATLSGCTIGPCRRLGLCWKRRQGALPLDPAGAVGPRPQFYLFRDWHWAHGESIGSQFCENGTENSRRAALMTAEARRPAEPWL